MRKHKGSCDQQQGGHASSGDHLYHFIMALEDKINELETAKEQLEAQLKEKEEILSLVNSSLEELQQQMEEQKKELTIAKSTVTKSKNALEKKEKVVSDLAQEVEAKNQSLAEKETEIEALKKQLEGEHNTRLKTSELQEKCRVIMLQQKMESCFISLDGHVFLSENLAKDYQKTNKVAYKTAQLVNGEEVLLT